MDVQTFSWVTKARNERDIAPGLFGRQDAVDVMRTIILPDTSTQIFALFANWVYSGRYQPGFLSWKASMSIEDAGPDGPLDPETETTLSTFLHACILGENICHAFYKEVSADLRRMYHYRGDNPQLEFTMDIIARVYARTHRYSIVRDLIIDLCLEDDLGPFYWRLKGDFFDRSTPTTIISQMALPHDPALTGATPTTPFSASATNILSNNTGNIVMYTGWAGDAGTDIPSGNGFVSTGPDVYTNIMIMNAAWHSFLEDIYNRTVSTSEPDHMDVYHNGQWIHVGPSSSVSPNEGSRDVQEPIVRRADAKNWECVVDAEPWWAA